MAIQFYFDESVYIDKSTRGSSEGSFKLTPMYDGRVDLMKYVFNESYGNGGQAEWHCIHRAKTMEGAIKALAKLGFSRIEIKNIRKNIKDGEHSIRVRELPSTPTDHRC